MINSGKTINQLIVAALLMLAIPADIYAQQTPPAANVQNDSVKVSAAQNREYNQLRTDYANLARFRADNAKIGLPAPGENRVVFMGNSITAGWSRLDPDFFAGKPYINRGIGGQTTPQMLVRFRQDVIDLKPEVVVILAGINDIAGNTGPSTLEMIEANLASMVEVALANGIKVILSSVLPAYDFSWRPGLEPAGKVVQLNSWIKSFSEMKGIIYLDFFTSMADEKLGLKTEYTKDGVHPTLAGYKIMDPLTEEAIQKALK